jgi:CDP-diacylglycerol pyrophosphatase
MKESVITINLVKLANLVILVILGSLVISCVDEEEFADTPQGNMEALWKIIDEHYCFLDYKQQEYGLDWDAVHQEYKERVK